MPYETLIEQDAAMRRRRLLRLAGCDDRCTLTQRPSLLDPLRGTLIHRSPRMAASLEVNVADEGLDSLSNRIAAWIAALHTAERAYDEQKAD